MNDYTCSLKDVRAALNEELDARAKKLTHGAEPVKLQPLLSKGETMSYNFWKFLRDGVIALVVAAGIFVGGAISYQHCPWMQANLTVKSCDCNCCPTCNCEDCDCCPACPGAK